MAGNEVVPTLSSGFSRVKAARGPRGASKRQTYTPAHLHTCTPAHLRTCMPTRTHQHFMDVVPLRVCVCVCVCVSVSECARTSLFKGLLSVGSA